MANEENINKEKPISVQEEPVGEPIPEPVKNDINNLDNELNDTDNTNPNDDELEVNYSSTTKENKEKVVAEDITKRVPRTRVTKPVSETVNDIVDDFICLPPNLQKEVKDILNKSDTLDFTSTEKSREWTNTLRDGMEHNTQSEIFVSGLDNEKADFDNEVKYNNIDIGIKTPIFKNNNLKGERALFRTIQDLDIGSVKTIPLFNSGFHIVLRPPTDIELLELNRRVAENKIALGIQTKGLVYSNTTYYLIECIIDFIRSHLYNTSLELEVGEDIMNYIVAQDIFDLIWGILCTMYPSGFNYKRACTSKPAECQYVASCLLNIDECLYVNKNALTDWQKSFMGKVEQKSKTKEEVKRYQDELSCMSMRSVELKANNKVAIKVLMRAPTVNEYINSGNLWVTTIGNRINEMMTIDDESEERRIERRNAYIIESGRATALRQYSHYVSAIEEIRGDSVNTHKDIDSINKYLDILSSDAEIRNNFFKHVTDYISNSTVSVVGIPVYTCPSCDTDQTQGTETHGEEFSEVIPLDMLSCFFSLLTQKISRISQR